MPSSLTVIQWVSDFSERVKQLANIPKQAASHTAKVFKVCSVVHVLLTSDLV